MNLHLGYLALLQSNATLAGQILAAVARAKDLGVQLNPAQLLMAASLTGQTPLTVLRDLTAPSARATNASPWTEESIRVALENLASRAGLNDPSRKGINTSGRQALMEDLLLHPHRSLQERATAIQSPLASMQAWMVEFRQSLGLLAGSDLRSALAQRAGIPLSEVVARIGISTDPALGRRVINMLPPTHRENIAELMLATSKPGFSKEIGALQFLDAVLRSGDPFIGSKFASQFVGHPFTSINDGQNSIYRTFAQSANTHTETRLNLLRTLGFNYSDILRMNPAGQALWERLDPAVGSYDAATYERLPQLPRSREEAAARILRADISYRDWIMLGVLSDRPWSAPSDIFRLYGNISVSGEAVASASRKNVFDQAELLLGREIPRGSTHELLSRDYQSKINRIVLLMFGLGSREIGSGKFGPTPPVLQLESWPAPEDRSGTRSSENSPQRGEDVNAPWQEFMPLLDPAYSSTAKADSQR
jgi:hypothetical protein